MTQIDTAAPAVIDSDPTVPNPAVQHAPAVTLPCTALDRAQPSVPTRSSDEWMALMYDDLRNLAYAQMRSQRKNHTLQPTALLHEAYARLKQRDVYCVSRAHFYHRAAQAMRDVLVEYARKRAALRRGGDLQRITCTTSVRDEREVMTVEELLTINRALEHLHTHSPEIARLVLLRYFGGLTVREVAETVGTSARTVERHLRVARAWLKDQLSPGAPRTPATVVTPLARKRG